jgi:hypothetical protein
MLIQMMQTDPRYNAIFQELTGIDMAKMGEDKARKADEDEETKKAREAQAAADQKARDAAEEARKFAEMPTEERALIQAKKDAEDKKL